MPRSTMRLLWMSALMLTVAVACSDSHSDLPAQEVSDSGQTDRDTTAMDAANSDTQANNDSGTTLDTDLQTDSSSDADQPDMPMVDPTLIQVRFEPEGEGFHRLPWPSDARLTASGTPFLGDFPGQDSLLRSYMDTIEQDVQGFATMPVIYFGLTGNPVAADAIPTVEESLADDSPVQLFEVGEEGCGQRVPIDVALNTESGNFSDANVLQLANVIGTVLKPGVPYAAVILTSFGAPEGRTTERSETFVSVLMDDTLSDPWSSALEPLRTCLPNTNIALDTIAAATVFTPQDPIQAMEKLRNFVMDPERLETRGVVTWDRDEAWSRRWQRTLAYSGTIPMPIFQEGLAPYDEEGGKLTFDNNGNPTIQRWEDVPFTAGWKTFDPPFEGVRPIAVFMDGTGWSPWSHMRSNWVQDALNRGYVIVSFMPQFHGERAGFSGSAELSTFNILNPDAGRTNFQQQAAETSYFLRLIREQIDGQENLPEINTDAVVYGGHSQGSLAGALNAAVEHEYSAYIFNGLSSYLTLTILNRKDILDFEGLISNVFEIERPLDRFHTVLQLMQLGTEVVDPHNYAYRWRGWESEPSGNHVFVSNGLMDDTTTKRGMDHLMISGDIPPIAPIGGPDPDDAWEIDEDSVWQREAVNLPIQGNATSLSGDPLTLATLTDAGQGHFTIYRKQRVRELALEFWRTAREEAIPTLVYNTEYHCGDGADDNNDGAIDCDDPSCEDRWPCVEGRCDDGEDDDGNGMIDCEDSLCENDKACTERDDSETDINECDDGEDDDNDGLVDCDDPDCSNTPPCGEGSCRDGDDGDENGLTDCEDPACAGISPFCNEICNDNRDNDVDGDFDCNDSDCIRSLHCPETVCDDGEDSDQNGLTDCDDPGCLGTEACPLNPETVCDDDEDNDGDERTDCDDPNCALDPACADENICADGDLGNALGLALLVGTIEGAENSYWPSECLRLGNGGDTEDVGLLWTAPSTGRFILSTYDSDFDTTISTYVADCSLAGEFACNDDNRPLDTSKMTLQIDEGITVLIVISGFDEDETGEFKLHIYPEPTP